jgi:hypothetical protein
VASGEKGAGLKPGLYKARKSGDKPPHSQKKSRLEAGATKGEGGLYEGKGLKSSGQ